MPGVYRKSNVLASIKEQNKQEEYLVEKLKKKQVEEQQRKVHRRETVRELKLVDNSELAGAADSLEGREVLQRDLDKLQGWAITNCMKFNKRK